MHIFEKKSESSSCSGKKIIISRFGGGLLLARVNLTFADRLIIIRHTQHKTKLGKYNTESR